jgi:predicted DNA-binding transcriptional regulator AlpA
MPRSKQQLINQRQRQSEQPLHADWFYRLIDAHKYFGYSPTVISEKIKSGEIPPPVSLSDSGRAKGWFGRVILEWQAGRQAKAK